MNILLSPFSSESVLEVKKNGDTLEINGEVFDFSPMKDGDTLPFFAITSEWITQDVERVDGQIQVTLRFPNPINASPEQRFPMPLLNAQDGPVALPQPIPMDVFMADKEAATNE
ncbi:hypothetical protein ACQR3P_01730 [Rhodococcus sp. IEGM1300]